jgi:hypothetical protein
VGFAMAAVILQSRVQVNRKEDTETSGILALIQQGPKIQLLWVPKASLDRKQLGLFHSQGILEHPEALNQVFMVELDSILCLTMEPQLSLFQNKACCLTMVTVKTTDERVWPALWFDPIENAIDSPLDVLYRMRHWVLPFKRDFVSVEEGSQDFYLTDKVQTHASRWPVGIPKPDENSPLFKMSAMGLDVVSTLLGTSTANVSRFD